MEKIFFFLLVNQKCYPTQLRRMLGLSLTSVQNSLARLEKGGILRSYYEGKTRMYEFHPAYPYLEELQSLLKKAFNFLPLLEKRNYYFVKSYSKEKGMRDLDLLLALWEKLKGVNSVDIRVSFFEKTGSKKGKADVRVFQEGDNILIFEEEGVWEKEKMHFKNTFRWTLNRIEKSLSLEHLRYGKENPTFLCLLKPSKAHLLESIHPHLCAEDIYFGQIHFIDDQIQLIWRILGPKKNQELEYNYSFKNTNFSFANFSDEL